MNTIFSWFILLGFSSLFSGTAKIDEPAPLFSLKNSDGKDISLSDFKGKIIILEWINFDCPFVKKHYGAYNMQSLQKEYTAKNVVWLSICSSAPQKDGYYAVSEIKERIKNYDAKMTHYLLDESGTVGRLYGAKTTPHIYVIDKTGRLVYAGGIDDIQSTKWADIKIAKNFVKSTLDEVLAGKTVTVKTSVPYGCSVKY